MAREGERERDGDSSICIYRGQRDGEIGERQRERDKVREIDIIHMYVLV